MAEEKTPEATPEQEAPQSVETPQAQEETQEVVAEAPTANTAEDFLENFNWHHYEEGIDVIEDKQLEEFEALVRENFVDTSDEDVIEGEVVYMTDREAIIDINAKSEGVISLNEFRYNPKCS